MTVSQVTLLTAYWHNCNFQNSNKHYFRLFFRNT